MFLYEGLIKILPIEKGKFSDAYNVRLEVSRLLDIQFLYGYTHPTLCILFEGNYLFIYLSNI